MFDVILHQPKIPPNTGNAIRLCANSGARLHLVRPLGFSLDDAQLRRAGLDYHEYASVQVHDTLDAAIAAIAQRDGAPPRVFALSTRGCVRFDAPSFRAGDVFVFGSETEGLPADVLDALPTGLPEQERKSSPDRPACLQAPLQEAAQNRDHRQLSIPSPRLLPASLQQ